MGLADRDYMRERVRRRVEAERKKDKLIQWPPDRWLVVTASAVLAVLVMIYVF